MHKTDLSVLDPFEHFKLICIQALSMYGTFLIVGFIDTIKTIALPPKSLQNEDLTGKTVRVSGWGRFSVSKYDI